MKLKLPKAQDNVMWDLWMSMYHLSILSVADELSLFNAINDKSISAEQLSKKIHINSRLIEILAEPLCGLKLLVKNKNKYSLNETSKTYLLPKSPFYWGAILEAQRNRNEHIKIMDAIKLGSNQLAFDNKSFTEMWATGSITPNAASQFTKKMHATIFAPALAAIKSGLFSKTNKLLDVGGGSGCFSVAFTQEYPNRKATVFDLSAVCKIAKKYIKNFKQSKKITTHEGNFFILKEWPKNHDGILLSQILHDWPLTQCKSILQNTYDSLPAGGKIYIHEMLLDTDKSSPLTTACFDLLMYINHKSQQFNKSELFSMLLDAGFKAPKIKKTFGYYSIITATK